MTKILFALLIIGSLAGLIGSLVSAPITGGTIFIALICLGVGVFSSIYLYKEVIGWNNFEKSEGFSLKRKKK